MANCHSILGTIPVTWLGQAVLLAISTCFRLKTADKGTDDEGPPSILGWGRLNPS